jgi:hypothetical protein
LLNFQKAIFLPGTGRFGAFSAMIATESFWGVTELALFVGTFVIFGILNWHYICFLLPFWYFGHCLSYLNGYYRHFGGNPDQPLAWGVSSYRLPGDPSVRRFRQIRRLSFQHANTRTGRISTNVLVHSVQPDNWIAYRPARGLDRWLIPDVTKINVR